MLRYHYKMRLLLAVVAVAALVASVSCSGGGGGASPTPTGTFTPTPTPTVSPSPTASPTATPGTITAHVTCSGPGCISGKLRTVVYLCATGDTVAVDSSGMVTLVDTTSVTVTVGVPAPATDCLHGIVDDAVGGTAVSGADPLVNLGPAGTATTTVIVDTYAM